VTQLGAQAREVAQRAQAELKGYRERAGRMEQEQASDTHLGHPLNSHHPNR
jgi:hypothetical protein